MYLLACVAVFLLAYLINITAVSILYHRGLAHRSVALSPAMRRWVVRFGPWVTGLDPKGWVCMHRRHHAFSDTPDDPHSPVHLGVLGVLFGQLISYERTLVGLARRDPKYTVHVEDLDFPTHWLNRKRIWFVPYLLHLAVAIAIAVPTGLWALAVCYWLGMMSHPLQGWMINSFGHAFGGRNFDTDDNARNNALAAWLVFGEGYQNNHHAFPRSAKFSYLRTEVDMGYGICRILERFGLLEVAQDQLIPAPRRSRSRSPGRLGSFAQVAAELPSEIGGA
jgi:stearoyl-CoA desaturase (delta-9 desaturase)